MNKLKLLPFILILALALCLGLSACGKDAAEQPPQSGLSEAGGAAEETGLIQPAYRAAILDLPGELGRLRKLAAAGDRLYVLGSGGIFVSTDVGESWNAVAVEKPEEEIMAMAASEDRIFFICSTYDMETMRLTAYAYDAADGSLLASWPLEGFDGAFSVNCVTYGGKLILSPSQSGTVYVYSPDGELLEQAEADGSVLFLAATPDFLLVCHDTADGMKAVSGLDADTGELSDLCPIDSEETPALSYVSQSGTYWTGDGGMYCLAADTALSEKLFSWSELALGSPVTDGFYCDSAGDFFLADSFSGCLYRISKYDGPPLKELVIGVGSGATYLTKAINIYNSASTEYYIRQESYNTENIDKALTEINAGKGPDILALGTTTNSQNPLAHVSVKSGLLEDLLPYIDSDETLNREDFLPGVLESMEENGGVYRLTPGINLNTITAPEKLAADLDGWDMDTLTQLSRDLPEGCILFGTWTRDFFMDSLCSFASVEFMDYESGTCCFDDPAFAKWLELVKDLKFEEDVENGEHLLSAGYTHPTQAIDILSGGGGYEFLGFPGREGARSYLTSETGGFSILSSSRNKEAAWEFIRLLLTPQIQDAINGPGFGLPVMKASFDAAAEDWLERGKDAGYTQADVDKFKAAMENSAGLARGSTVSDMIKEEAEKYFAGQKSLEDTVELLQSRARIYLAEQG